MPGHQQPMTSYVPMTSCDTMVAFTGPADRRRAVFAKNSDRPTREAQPLTRVDAAAHAPGSTVECQYLTIPQAPRTLAVLGSRPSWIWGFEHGVNEAGVAIGNEAVHTHDPIADTGLMGMDLVRLGLERGATAAEAKRVITGLLEEYGQGGVCGRASGRSYHNSFLVADHTEAWVIETSARHWVAKRTTRGAAIANLLTIEDDWDDCSDGLEAYARERGYWSAPARLNFRAAFEDGGYRGYVEERWGVGCRLLAERDRHSVRSMMRYLRDHFATGDVYAPAAGDAEPVRTVCLHPVQWVASSTASMVVELTGDDLPPVAWTSMATPCTSVFLPVAVGQELPAALEAGDDVPSRDSAWWAMRELQYAVDRDPELLTPIVRAVWAPIEERLLAGDGRLGDEELSGLVAEVMERRDDLIFQLAVARLERECPTAY